ncbi:protein FAM13B isoform X3 [Nematostella vectensis]|uniref:protein FAM13B isoform X3 n=1 Tax=Nematostella vectensis TaxID=45351 RepID=UPI0020774188|nr:protein FAM13B isoform X3 [Nematostella vectensis]
MSTKDGASNSRQWSIESGLTQAIRPVLVCTTDKKIATKSASDQLSVPQTTESKMAKMRKKIQSPLVKRKGPQGSVGSQVNTGNKQFGVPLEEVTKSRDGSPIPWVLAKIVHYLSQCGLKHEGIFRVSGNHKVVESLKATFDRDGDADLEECDVMAVAGLLKLFLRELPEPPVPQSLTADFIKVHEVYGDDNPDCLDELRALLDKLPYLNYELLKFLCHFLVEVSMNEENNKMSTMALAIVFGPNFFRCKDGLDGLREQGHTNSIVCMFLKEYDQLFKDEGDEISPYATTTLFINDHTSDEPESPDHNTLNKVQQIIHESSTSDEENTKSNVAAGADQPIYAAVKKPKKNLRPNQGVSSSSEELDVYVRSVSPSWTSGSCSNGHPPGTSQTVLPSPRHGSAGRDVVQMAINDSIKEHLFGPDGVSTDETEPSDLSRHHSSESLDDGQAPPLPSRNYGEEEVSKQRRKRRKNVRNSKEENGQLEGEEPMKQQEDKDTSSGTTSTERPERPNRPKKKNKPKPLNFDEHNLVITVDKNSNTVIKTVPRSPQEKAEEEERKHKIAVRIVDDDEDADVDSDEGLSRVSRNSDILSPLTLNRAPPPKNRRRPSLKKSPSGDDADNLNEIERDLLLEVNIPDKFVHPLVEEAKSRDPVATPPPRSPRSPKVTMSPPPSPGRHATVDELDCGHNPVRELTKQYKQHHRASPLVPPLELYKLQQGDIDDHVQRSPREKYDGLGSEEALLSPRTRPLMIDTKRSAAGNHTSCPECPPSPPHEQLDHYWYERRVETSPKGEITIKQLAKNIHQLKKRIREFEESFETEHGYKPSQADKAPIKRQVAELTRCRKQLKEMREKAKEESERLNETAPPASDVPDTDEPLLTTSPASVQQSLNNILRKLQDKRRATGRPEELKSMSLEMLHDEKLAVQKALLQHESVFGRPTSKKDKDIMRPLYDRYRMIKRNLAIHQSAASDGDPSPGSSKHSSREELDSINDEDANSSEDLFSSGLLKTLESSAFKKTLSPSTKRRSRLSDTLEDDDDPLEDTVTVLKEHDTQLHRLSQDELEKQVECAKREKKRLRKKLKKFEDDFFERTGRRIQRDDRGEMEKDYHDYKQLKARLRLLDALLTKRQASQTI